MHSHTIINDQCGALAMVDSLIVLGVIHIRSHCHISQLVQGPISSWRKREGRGRREGGRHGGGGRGGMEGGRLVY